MSLDDAQQREKKADIAEDFAWLVLLAKIKTKDDLVKFATREWNRAKRWIASDEIAEGSFLWCCDLYDLDAKAVRKAIEKGAK